jgi:hypothetical protein
MSPLKAFKISALFLYFYLHMKDKYVSDQLCRSVLPLLLEKESYISHLELEMKAPSVMC